VKGEEGNQQFLQFGSRVEAYLPVASRPYLAPRQRLPALLKSHAFDKTRRHTVNGVDVFQSRITKQGKAGNAEQCVEHVHHVTRPVRDSSTLGVLKVGRFIPETKKKTYKQK